MLATITLATRYGWFGTWLGSTLGMVAADALAILVGRLLGRHLPERAIKYGASGLFFAVRRLAARRRLRTAQPGLADRRDRRGAQPPPRRVDRARARARHRAAGDAGPPPDAARGRRRRPAGVAAGHAGMVGPRPVRRRRAARARGPAAGRDGRRAADRAVRRAGLGRGRGRGGAAGHRAADRGAALPGGAAGAGRRPGDGDPRPARPGPEPGVDRHRAGHGRAAAHGADAASACSPRCWWWWRCRSRSGACGSRGWPGATARPTTPTPRGRAGSCPGRGRASPSPRRHRTATGDDRRVPGERHRSPVPVAGQRSSSYGTVRPCSATSAGSASHGRRRRRGRRRTRRRPARRAAPRRPRGPRSRGCPSRVRRSSSRWPSDRGSVPRRCARGRDQLRDTRATGRGTTDERHRQRREVDDRAVRRTVVRPGRRGAPASGGHPGPRRAATRRCRSAPAAPTPWRGRSPAGS